MTAELRPLRVHDDGRVALYLPSSQADYATELPWWSFRLVDEVWVTDFHRDEDVAGPGWRVAAIVPLPEPVGESVEWRGQWSGVVQLTAAGSVCLGGYGFMPPDMARDLAAALLAGADHAEHRQADQSNTDVRRTGPYPEGNCYCGGPEETIYPHRKGTGYYCRRQAEAVSTDGR